MEVPMKKVRIISLFVVIIFSSIFSYNSVKALPDQHSERCFAMECNAGGNEICGYYDQGGSFHYCYIYVFPEIR